MGAARVTLIALSIATIFSIGITSQLAYGGPPNAGSTIPASDGDGPSFQSGHPVIPGPCNLSVFPLEGCAEDIIETVTFCPTCGPWVKTFDASSIVFGPTAPDTFVIHVHEFLTIQGTDWNDWHERIVTPGWIYIINLPTTPIVTTPAGVTATIVTMAPNELWIDFDPPLLQSQQPPQLTILKYMECTIIGGCDPRVVVEQFPTVEIPIGGTLAPIDTTALLLAGVQSISMWMIPVVIAGVGIGIFVVIRRK